MDLGRKPLTAIILSDGKPGHYHQSEGVIAAIARMRPIRTVRIDVRRRFVVPTRSLHQLVNSGAAPGLVLWLGYGIRANALPPADLIVSAGGETLAANAAAARLMGVPNIFCGRLRRVAPEHVRLVIVSLDRLAGHPNYLVSLPPSPLEPQRAATGNGAVRYGRSNPPGLVGALIGGNSGAFHYTAQDWNQLARFIGEAHRTHGIRWMVTTSRRSGPYIANVLAELARRPGGVIERFVDYRVAGPGTVTDILTAADAILCTDDSTTMLSEAVGARLPVVAVGSDDNTLDERESEYRRYLERNGWSRTLPMAALTPEAFLAALEGITPRTSSPLEELAAGLQQRLPELFDAA